MWVGIGIVCTVKKCDDLEDVISGSFTWLELRVMLSRVTIINKFKELVNDLNIVI